MQEMLLPINVSVVCLLKKYAAKLQDPVFFLHAFASLIKRFPLKFHPSYLH